MRVAMTSGQVNIFSNTVFDGERVSHLDPPLRRQYIHSSYIFRYLALPNCSEDKSGLRFKNINLSIIASDRLKSASMIS